MPATEQPSPGQYPGSPSMSPPLMPPLMPPMGPPPYGYHPSGYSDQSVPPGVLQEFQSTRPWVMFLGIVGVVLACLSGLGALITMAGGARVPGMAGIGCVQLIFAGIWLIIPILTLRYASASRTLLMSPCASSLESAVSAQKSYWKAWGIFMIVILALFAIGMIIMIAAAGSMAREMRHAF
jgi:hypothetical protein